MATLVFWGYPGHGHVNPSLPLVAELVQQGERVYYYSLEEFRPAIERAGATFCPYGEAFPLALMLQQRKASAQEKAYGQALSIQWVFERLLPEVETLHPDYLITDAQAPWGNLTAQALRVPAICFQTSLAINGRVIIGFFSTFLKMLTQRGEKGKQDKGKQNAQALLDNLSQTYHLKKMRSFDVFLQKGSLNLVCTSPLFQPYANSFDRERYRFVGPILQPRPEAPAFPFERLAEGKPLIYISLGTMVAEQAPFFCLCMQAFAQSKWQVVIAVGKSTSPGILQDIPTNCLIQQFVPQLEILQRASLFITHGGMNSVNEALAYNVPLVIVPQGADQHLIAKQVEKLGAGKQLSAQDLTAEKIRQAVEEVLTQPTYTQAARRIGESLRTAGGSHRAVTEIQTWKQTVGITPD